MHSIDCYCEGEGGVNNDRKNEVLTMMMMMSISLTPILLLLAFNRAI
jgi:hypothetical protein